MALAEVLRVTHSVHDEVKVIDGRPEGVRDKVEDIDDRVEDIGDKVQSVSENVQAVIDGARHVPTQLLIPANVYTFRRQGSKSSSAGSQISYQTNGKPHRRSQVFVIS
jgi:uncharacterized protein YoxC